MSKRIYRVNQNLGIRRKNSIEIFAGPFQPFCEYVIGFCVYKPNMGSLIFEKTTKKKSPKPYTQLNIIVNYIYTGEYLYSDNNNS